MENNINQTKTGNKGEEGVLLGIANSIISNFPRRSGDIIRKRFGLSGKRAETLEKIGTEHNITRERARQIIFDVLKKVSEGENKALLEEAEKKIILAIEKNSGIITEAELKENISRGDFREAGAVLFFTEASKKILPYEEKRAIKKSRIVSVDVIVKVKKVEAIACEIFQQSKNILTSEDLIGNILKKTDDLSKYQVANYLSVLEKIGKNRFGKWGMSDWDEINPKGTREKIYLILKEKGEPAHFTAIAKMIDEYGLGNKKAHPQTVHNELIKDSRFVLVGRGIYALAEWGYSKGTVKEVIEDILKKSKRPLGKEDILREILKMRRVKKTTIMINLNNSKMFAKQNNLYTIKNTTKK